MNCYTTKAFSAVLGSKGNVINYWESEKVTSFTGIQFLSRVAFLSKEISKYTEFNQPILLAFPQSSEFLISFFACLKNGNIAVPSSVPLSKLKTRSKNRIFKIIEQCSCKTILTNRQVKKSMLTAYPEMSELNLIAVDEILESFVESESSFFDLISIRVNEVAFLQYTSGSTSDPKGVVVTQANLYANAFAQNFAMGNRDYDIYASWLPQFHDMGLIGTTLTPLMFGHQINILSPYEFIKRPLSWLSLISKTKATVTGAPNFAFSHCLDNLDVSDVSNLDLSKLSVMFCGAEPINKSIITRFFDKFSLAGLRQEVFFPCYGLAEGTLIISGKQRDKELNFRAIKATDELNQFYNDICNCGPVIDQHEVVIVDPNTREIKPKGDVGELWIKGPSVCAGYYKNEHVTENIFRAFTLSGDGPYLRSGDLGFISENDIFICGRQKDMMIFSGKNIYPNDIEQVVEDNFEEVRRGSLVAFQNGASIYLAVELTKSLEIDINSLKNRIINSVWNLCEIGLKDVIFVKRGGLPKTTSGKVQRKLTSNFFKSGELNVLDFKESLSQNLLPHQNKFVKERLKKIIQDELKVDDINNDQNFGSLGMTSKSALVILGKIEKVFEKKINISDIYNYPNLEKLAEFLADQSDYNCSNSIENETKNKFAITGLAFNLPGVSSLEDLHEVFKNGKIVSDNQEVELNFKDTLFEFDNIFFNVSKNESTYMDPQQRKILENVHECFENSGLKKADIVGKKVGVYVAATNFDYAHKIQDHNSPYFATGNSPSMLSNRVSYFYDLIGPSLTVDTACSSSIVALNLALEGLKSGMAEKAIVSAVNFIFDDRVTSSMESGSFLSSDKICHVFDEKANGYKRSSGLVTILVEKLETALDSGRKIHAVIEGILVAQDGQTQGISAPNGIAQKRLFESLYFKSPKECEKISYLECHGTGTQLGDPIECHALYEGISKYRDSKMPIGSAKANFGHLEAAAGLLGVVKAILMINKKILYPTAGFLNPNKHIEFDKLNLEVLKEKKIIEKDSIKIGISSFGFGGTIAHVVLSNTQEKKKKNNSSSNYLIPISAKSLFSLEKIENHVFTLSVQNNLKIEHANFFKYFRDHYMYRSVFNLQENRLIKAEEKKVKSRKLAFIFPGQGGHYSYMGKNLYASNDTFRLQFDLVSGLIKENYGIDLIYTMNEDDDLGNVGIEIIQPYIFAICISLAKTISEMGFVPDVCLGHSMGEVASCYVSGVLSLKEAVDVICTRSLIMSQIQGSQGMLATNFSIGDAQRVVLAFENVFIAAVNGKENIILAGDRQSCLKIQEEYHHLNDIKFINVSIASHTPYVEPLTTNLVNKLSHIVPKKSSVDIISSVESAYLSGEKFNATYWGRNLSETVNFQNALACISNLEDYVVVEVGPQPVLLHAILNDYPQVKTLYCLNKNQKELESDLISKLEMNLFLSGCNQKKKEVNLDFEAIPYFFEKGHFQVNKKIASNETLISDPLNKSRFLAQINLDRYVERSINHCLFGTPTLSLASIIDIIIFINGFCNILEIELIESIRCKENDFVICELIQTEQSTYLKIFQNNKLCVSTILSSSFLNIKNNWLKESDLNKIEAFLNDFTLGEKIIQKAYEIGFSKTGNNDKSLLLDNGLWINFTDFDLFDISQNVFFEIENYVLPSDEYQQELKLIDITNSIKLCDTPAKIFYFLRDELNGKKIICESGNFDNQIKAYLKSALNEGLISDDLQFVFYKNQEDKRDLIIHGFPQTKKGFIFTFSDKNFISERLVPLDIRGSQIKKFDNIVVSGGLSSLSRFCFDEYDKIAKCKVFLLGSDENKIKFNENFEGKFEYLTYSEFDFRSSDLKGSNLLIHFAGTTSDNLIPNVTTSEIEKVYYPKVNLIEKILNLAINFEKTVFISSMSSLLGGFGSSTYSMANSYFLDNKRERLVNLILGPVENSTLSRSSDFVKTCGNVLSVKDFKNILRYSIVNDKEIVIGFSYDIDSVLQSVNTISSEILPGFSQSINKYKNSFLTDVNFREVIENEIKKILNIDHELNLDLSFKDYGLDSMLLTNLKKNFFNNYNLQIPISLFWSSPSIKDFINEISKILFSDEGLESDSINHFQYSENFSSELFPIDEIKYLNRLSDTDLIELFEK